MRALSSCGRRRLVNAQPVGAGSCDRLQARATRPTGAAGRPGSRSRAAYHVIPGPEGTGEIIKTIRMKVSESPEMDKERKDVLSPDTLGQYLQLTNRKKYFDWKI